MNPQMFNSFLDGTKSAIEMAAVANATGLTPAPDGLAFPPCGVDDLPRVLRPKAEGGLLDHKGQVEVISSLERDGRPVFRDLRWGVYVVFEAPSDYVKRCFAEYGLVTDPSGRYTALYKPYPPDRAGARHLGRERRAARRSDRRADRLPRRRGRDRQARPRRRRDAGRRRRLHRLGQADAGDRFSLRLGGLPIGLAHHVKLRRAGEGGRAADAGAMSSSTRPAKRCASGARWKRCSATGRRR